MAKGIFVADTCDALRVPDFIPAAKRTRLHIEIPERLFTYRLGGVQYLHLLVLHDSNGRPLTVTAQNRCVYWVSASGVRPPRARRLLKRLRLSAWRSASWIQLMADTRPVAVHVKTSPDLRRPLTFDDNGTVLTFEPGLAHTVLGYSHPTEADTTTVAEIDAATAEDL